MHLLLKQMQLNSLVGGAVVPEKPKIDIALGMMFRGIVTSKKCLSTSDDKPQGQEQAVSLSVLEMVQMTMQNYRRFLQEFSESPVMSRCSSLSSSQSLVGASQSITEWLVLWEKDPVEILLDLGFGTEEPDVCTKIPSRFLSGASVAKGINIRVFLEAQKQRMDIERPNLYERFRQLELFDHVTSALSSLLTNVNTQQTQVKDGSGDEIDLLDSARSRPAVTQAKQRRIGQLLKKASQQTALLKQDSLAPGEANLSSKKAQYHSCADTAEREIVQIQSFEDETPCGNAPDTTSAEVLVTRTSSCQSDSSGFMEELPEPVVLQNASLSRKINFISYIHNQETALSDRTEFAMLSQDFQQKLDDRVAKVFVTACESILTVPESTKRGSDQGEETHLLLTAENGEYEACNAEPQSFVQEILCDMDRKEDKIGRKQLEKEKCIKEHSFCFQSDTQNKGDPISSKFDHLYFKTGHKTMNAAFTELIDFNSADISESKIRGEDECERCLTEKDVGVTCHENAHGGHKEHVKGPWLGMEVVNKDGTLLAVNKVTNDQKFCKMDGDSKNTRCSSKTELLETPQQGSAAQSRSSASSCCSPQVSWRHLTCLAEGPRLSLSVDQKTGSIGKMLGANESEQGDTIQNNEMASAPLKSVTVQMFSGLEFTSRVKRTGQNAPFSDTLAREDSVDSSDDDSLRKSDPGASKDGVKRTTEASSQTDICTRKPRWPPLCHPPHAHLTKSASLDTVLSGKYRPYYWSEASDIQAAQGSHCCHCCCCCHGCCPWTFSVPVSPQHPVGCCSNRAPTELQVLKTLMLLQDAATCDLVPCNIHEIEVMKSSCQHFQEKLDEIEQHLTEQQVLFASMMPDEEREEGRHLQLLRRAVRQEVAELQFWLNDQACQVREGILMQLDQLLAEQSHLFSELGLPDWSGERKAQNEQAFPDAADIVHPQSGCSEMVLQRAPSKNTTATGLLSALQSGPSPMQFHTRATFEANSAASAPQELSTSTKEMKGPP
ncbi:coiled-coil domain containing 129 [Columba livia]|uniref:Coiled-coil domain containing 129 n=1 Tax=Columba livia TaxID=8932 RepID=A0A2I0LPG7_COLLI|nr:coiled-coil domain containing 129 [Columba livia]